MLLKQTRMPSLQTNVWGPPQWLILHLLALTYPNSPSQDDRLKYAQRIRSTLETLPCSICQRNVAKNVAHLGLGTPEVLPTTEALAASPYFESSDTLFYFTFRLHNEVNAMLKKPIVPESQYTRIRHQYQLAYAKSSSCADPTAGEAGCTTPADGYKPCMTRIALVPRSLETDQHGPAIYLASSLQQVAGPSS